MTNLFGKLWRTHALILIALLLSHCAEPAKVGHVAKGWALAMRELQIVPVFPPREDVQIGDIYIVPAPPEEEEMHFEEKGYLPRGIWIHTVKLNDVLDQFYAQRSNFPTTGQAPVTHVDIAPPAEAGKTSARADLPSNTDGSSVYKSGTTSRLRLVGFPSFMSATFNQGDLSSFFPVEAGNIAAGASFTKSDSVTVKVPVAESCGLPASLVVRRMRYEAENLVKSLDADNKDDFNPFAGIGDLVQAKYRVFVLDKDGAVIEEKVRVRIATEVFYARVVEVSMHAKEARGGMLDWLTGQDGGNKGGGQSPQKGGGQHQGGGANIADPNHTAEQTAANFRKHMEANKQKVPGVSLEVVSVSQSSIGMRRIYDKPVAIGFRGFDVNVILGPDGEYLRMEPVGVTNSSLSRSGQAKAKPKNDSGDKPKEEDDFDKIQKQLQELEKESKKQNEKNN